ncbi:hypothetical protein MBLNU459_g0159t1 [Dothideomycetes sp. NU459]
MYALTAHLSLLPTPPRNYSTPTLRHELRLKPFLPCGTPALPTAADLAAATTFPATTPVSAVSATADAHLKAAKQHLAALKSADGREGKFAGCEADWARDVQGMLLSCIAAGVAGAGVRGLCAKAGVESVGDVATIGKKDELRTRIEVKVPEAGERYHAWWAVPKVVERK